MPFAPLPGPFLDEAGAVAHRAHLVLEPGSGQGDFARVLRGLGLTVVGLDPAAAPGALDLQIKGDALRPPLAAGCCDLVVAANLVRHLAPRQSGLACLGAWAGLLRPGGAVFVFEDAPRPAQGAAGNYGRLQDLLAGLMPGARGPLLGRNAVEAAARRLGLRAAGGTWTNAWPLDARRVIGLLAGGEPAAGSPVARLIEDIERDGIACGPAWWLRLDRET